MTLAPLSDVLTIKDMISWPRPTALLWDMDGVLVHSDHLWKDGYIGRTLAHGHIWTDTDTMNCRGKTNDDIHSYLATILTASLAGIVIAEVLAHVVSSITTEMLSGPSLRILDHFYRAGVPMALVTSSPRTVVDRYLELIGSNPFQVVITGADVTKGKPDPEGYLKAATLLGVHVQDCWVVEDSNTGVQAAIASGGRVIAINQDSRWQDSDRLHKVTSLSGVADYLSLPTTH